MILNFLRIIILQIRCSGLLILSTSIEHNFKTVIIGLILTLFLVLLFLHKRLLLVMVEMFLSHSQKKLLDLISSMDYLLMVMVKLKKSPSVRQQLLRFTRDSNLMEIKLLLVLLSQTLNLVKLYKQQEMLPILVQSMHCGQMKTSATWM